jgi:hypothetical protein
MARDAPRTVEVTGMRDPQMHAYRGVWAGLDAFDRYHGLAPQATLQFRIKPRFDNQGATIAGITLAIVGQGDALPVPISADGLFTIGRLQQAYDERADLVFNHKRHLFTAYPEVRTPGLAANVRRVGDLRLECQVNVAIIKTDMPFYARTLVSGLFGGTDWCDKIGVYRSIAVKEVSRATLVHGARRVDFPLVGLRDTLKIAEAEWPDDALLELELAAPAPP